MDNDVIDDVGQRTRFDDLINVFDDGTDGIECSIQIKTKVTRLCSSFFFSFALLIFNGINEDIIVEMIFRNSIRSKALNQTLSVEMTSYKQRKNRYRTS